MHHDSRPSDAPLARVRILVFVGDDYEDLELWYPKLRLEEAGAHVTVAGAVPGHVYSGKHGYPCASDVAIGDMEAEDFHGVVIAGGWMPDKLRRDPKVLSLVREFSASGKLVAAICHGGWIPISARILKGRRATGSLGATSALTVGNGIFNFDNVGATGALTQSLGALTFAAADGTVRTTRTAALVPIG